jgi:hypothetical protein
MTRSLLVRLGVVVASLTLLVAQAPSDRERAACRQDAMSLCRSHVGKPQQMNACLRENKGQLSEACRAVVDKRGG